MADVVKSDGRRPTESFDRLKLHRSLEAACLSVRTPSGEAAQIAHDVSAAIANWLKAKFEVTSHDIRRMAGAQLELFHPDAAYLYQHHRLVL